MTDAGPIIFLHMMKTGGLTMVNILREAFGPQHTYKYGNTKGSDVSYLPDFLNATRNPDINVYIGHFGYGVQNQFDSPVRFVTILRHPIERVVSLCHYLDISLIDHNAVSNALSTLPEAQNGMVRRLNGLAEADYAKGDTRAINWHNLAKTAINIPLNEHHLLEAQKALGTFKAIGVQENFPETLLLFRDRLNCPPLFNIERPFLNHSPVKQTRDSIDPYVIEQIECSNQLDLRLYDDCRSNFNLQIEELEKRRFVELSVQRLLNDGLSQRGKQVLNEAEAFAKLQSMINGLVQSDRLAEAACLLCYILSKPLDRDTASICLDLLTKIGNAEDVERETTAFNRTFG